MYISSIVIQLVKERKFTSKKNISKRITIDWYNKNAKRNVETDSLYKIGNPTENKKRIKMSC